MLTLDPIEKINLLDEQMMSPELKDTVMSYLQDTINFYNLKRLTLWEGNHNCNLGSIDKKIKELKQQKKLLKELGNKHIELVATLQFKYAEVS